MIDLIVFILVLSVLIVVHEWGHFITAKKCGVDVKQFALGFGPVLFTKQHDGTDFQLRLIPLGGFVRMAGDEKDNCTGAPDEFYSKPVKDRAMIVFNGPLVNFVFAYLCFVVMFMMGPIDMEATNQQVKAMVGAVVEGRPAQEAGILEGDIITSVQGESVGNWYEMQKAIGSFQGNQMTLGLDRDGQMLTVSLNPEFTEGMDETGRTIQKAVIGIQNGQEITKEDFVFEKGVPIHQAFVKAGQELWRITYLTYSSLYGMVTGVVSPKNMAGPVGIYSIIGSAASIGFSHLLWVVGLVSASLAIFNLLPIFPLDGGHLFLMMIEKIKGNKVSEKFENIFVKFGSAVMITLVLFIFYVDFDRIGLFDKAFQIWNKIGL